MELILGYREYMCSCPWDGEHIWLPDASTGAEAGWYTVEPDAALQLGYAPASQAARLTGVIGGAWLALGFDETPHLSLVGLDSTTLMGERPVFSDGSFELFVYQVQPLKLLITHEGLTQYLGGPDFLSATVFDPSPGQIISGIQTLTCAVTLDTSRPMDTDQGTGNFEVYSSDGQTLLGTIDGSRYFKSLYILPNLWPGDFLLRAVPQPREWGQVSWAPQWYPGVADLSDAEPVTLTQPGEILPLSMTVLEGGSIAGDLTGAPDPDGRWHALATPADAAAVWGFNYIFGPETAYNLIGLPDGDWKVGVTPINAPGDTLWYPGTADWAASTVVTITDGAEVAGIDIPVGGGTAR